MRHINIAMEAFGVRTPNMLNTVHTLDQHGEANFNVQVSHFKECATIH